MLLPCCSPSGAPLLSGVQHLRDVTDPEHPYTLEQLNVVSEDLIDVRDDDNLVR